MSGCPDSLTEMVRQSEVFLVLNKFKAAEDMSREVLKRTLYDPGHGSLEDRAAVVLIQSLYETRRFSSVKGELVSFFGRLSSAPVNALLLYLSLALDFADARAEAQAMTLELLQTRAPGEPGGWTRRQYAALVHLYVFEMLVPELSDPSQAQRWLEESALPIPAGIRAALVSELKSAFPDDGSPFERGAEAMDGLRRGLGPRAVVPGARSTSLLEDALGALRPVRTVGSDSDESAGLPGSLSTSPDGASQGSIDSSRRIWPQSWREAGEALGALAGKCGDAAHGAGDDSAADGLAANLASALVGGTILLVAGYVVVHRRRQVQHGMWNTLRALGDVFRMGLQLSPSSIPRAA